MKKQNGEFVGKLAPYGYIKDPKDKHKFLIDKNVSHIIRKIFDMILDGESRRQVAEFLNDNDILTPSEYLNINTLLVDPQTIIPYPYHELKHLHCLQRYAHRQIR